MPNMSLPKTFSTNEEYFERCLQFFTKYQFLISHPNTHLLVNNLMDNITIEDCSEHIDLDDKNFKLSDLRNKSRLIDDFLKELDVLSVSYDNVEEIDEIIDFDAPICPKKKYEVVRLTEEVTKMCKDCGCDTVVDIGSGLGYLDQRLHSVAGLNVLGLESSKDHITRAVQRQTQYHPSSVGKVVYHQMRVGTESADDIGRSLKDNFKTHGPVCMTGLHACGDLSVDGINLFLKMDDVKALILMPCCYHRMHHKENRFTNFPISTTLRSLSKKHEGLSMGVPFLRLAAHPTVNQQGLREMSFSLLARAVLQLYAERSDYVLKKNKRKAIKACSSFDDYLKPVVEGYSLMPSEGVGDERIQFDLDQLLAIWTTLPPSSSTQAAVYIQLQNWLQPVVENFLLLDRLVYLQENGVNSWHRKFFRENQSPRCIALLAVKDNK